MLKQPPNVNTWTDKEVQLFWNYYGKRADLHEEYFSYQVGKALVNLLLYTGRLGEGASVLDYGCGPGFLLKHFLDLDVNCQGADFSSEAVQLVNRKFETYPNWNGATALVSLPTPFPESSFDVVTCIETVEHLIDDRLSATINEIYRLLKAGGIALFTTPNNENLSRNYIFCPFCQSEFHRVQHVRSFSEASLRTLLESYGFNTLFCRGINLWEFQQQKVLPDWKKLSMESIHDWSKHKINVGLDRLRPLSFPFGREFNALISEGPHLCAIVERPKL